MEDGITFRRLETADLTDYRTLRLECLREWPQNFGADHAEEAAKPVLKMEEAILGDSPELWAMGAWENGQMIGMCGIARDPGHNRRHIGRVVQMYVQAAYSGRKVGYRLLQATIAEAWRTPELEQLVLEVVTSSPHAVYMYGQAGFEQFGFHRGFLKIGDVYQDAYYMIRFRGAGE